MRRRIWEVHICWALSMEAKCKPFAGGEIEDIEGYSRLVSKLIKGRKWQTQDTITEDLDSI